MRALVVVSLILLHPTVAWSDEARIGLTFVVPNPGQWKITGQIISRITQQEPNEYSFNYEFKARNAKNTEFERFTETIFYDEKDTTILVYAAAVQTDAANERTCYYPISSLTISKGFTSGSTLEAALNCSYNHYEAINKGFPFGGGGKYGARQVTSIESAQTNLFALKIAGLAILQSASDTNESTDLESKMWGRIVEVFLNSAQYFPQDPDILVLAVDVVESLNTNMDQGAFSEISLQMFNQVIASDLQNIPIHTNKSKYAGSYFRDMTYKAVEEFPEHSFRFFLNVAKVMESQGNFGLCLASSTAFLRSSASSITEEFTTNVEDGAWQDYIGKEGYNKFQEISMNLLKITSRCAQKQFVISVPDGNQKNYFGVGEFLYSLDEEETGVDGVKFVGRDYLNSFLLFVEAYELIKNNGNLLELDQDVLDIEYSYRRAKR